MYQPYSSDLSPTGATVAAILVADAQAALGRDMSKVRQCLRQLSALLEPATPNSDTPERPDLPEPTGSGGLATWQATGVIAHVEVHYNRSITIAELSSLASLSEGHFCRAFKAQFGQTPHGYVVSRRVAHAKRMMLTTHEPLSSVACGCGFTDQAHLTRIFRRDVGETPSAWRVRTRKAH